MKNWVVRSFSVCVLAIGLFVSGAVRAQSVQTGDGKDVSKDVSKDTSKEAPIVQKSWCETPPPFEVNIALPGWFSGVSGDAGVKGVVANTDIPFHKLLDHLTHVPIVLALGVRYQRWEFFADGQYYVVGDSVTLPGLLFTNADLHLKLGIVDAFVGYRVINCDKATLTLFTGIRYNYIQGNFSIFDNGDARLVILRQLLGLPKKLDFSDSTGWVDPVVGARGKIRIWKPISLWAEADVGGFDANAQSAFTIHRDGRRNLVRDFSGGSDWSYQVQGGLEIQLTRQIWTQAGWRWLNYDYEQAGFTNKLALSGPFLQTGISF